MRKHDVRKWLHAILDLLPVILIPVFMIYSHRHTIDSGSIDVPQNQVVDFNQLIKNGEPTSLQYYSILDGNTISYSNNEIEMVATSNTSYITLDYSQGSAIADNDDIKLVKYDFESSALTYYTCGDTLNNFYGVSSKEFITTKRMPNMRWQFVFSDSSVTTNYVNYLHLQVFNLTQMFGSGNEPTIEQFNQWYSDDYYEYTLSHKELLKGTSSITYDDTGIMSQVVFQLYNSVDKYFNMGNVFNMTGVYDWFNLNIFNGNAPISIYIVWNIVLYEFVMDLLFLLYGLFMWFIDMVEKIMDKPFKSIK